jgi:hypothetical protein
MVVQHGKVDAREAGDENVRVLGDLFGGAVRGLAALVSIVFYDMTQYQR